MAEGSRDDDPFDWEVDRVVKELCTTDRTWRPTPRAKLPDPVELEEKLRDGEYDGDLLLSCTEKDLWDDLEITRPKFKVAMRSAIAQFKSRSQKYKKYKKHLVQADNSESDDGNQRRYQQQFEAPHQAYTPISDISGPATALPSGQDQSGPDAMQLDQDLARPPSKKRRLATSALITTQRAALPQDQPFNIASIPTEADNMSFLPTEADDLPLAGGTRDPLPLPEQPPSTRPDTVSIPTEAPTEPAEDFEENCKSNPGAYWGNGKLPRMDIINRLTTVDADPGMDFGWGEPQPFGKARKKYTCRVVQKHLLYPNQRTAPEEDPVLPAYGESDDDDNSEWSEVAREMQTEEEEIRLEKEEVLGLVPEEVDVLLKQMVEECATTWHETKLPKEKHKAFGLWNKVRRHGTRRLEMQVLSTELRRAEQGLEKILKGLKDNQYSSEAELRGMSPSLEPYIHPIEHIKWLIRTISSPNAPEKAVRPQTQVQTNPKPRSAQDSIDIWSEDELEDQMRDFIVDDDPLPEADALPDDHHEDFIEHTGIDQPAFDIPAVPVQSFVSSTDGDDVEMHDLTTIDHTPAPDLDLTEMVISPRKKPASSLVLTTLRSSLDLEKPPLNDVKAIANKGCGYWESKGDAKRLMINMLSNQSPMMRRSVLKAVNFVDSDEAWYTGIVYGCENWNKTFDKASREKVWHHTALLLVRLFNVFEQGCRIPPPATISKEYNKTLEWANDNKEHFNPFWDFLKLVAVYFETSRNAVAKNDSSDNVQSPLTPGTKRKHDKEEGDASQEFREKDGRRQLEQQARRLQLRKQVEGSKISLEQSRLIINESKLNGQNLIYIHPHIAPLIKDHQIDGVRFMWDQLLSESDQGCLLAHTMGLGKTMQVITLLTAIQDAAQSSDSKVSCQIPDRLKESRTLILCPAGLLGNWMDELLYWAPEGLLGELFSIDATLSKGERARIIQHWAQDGGVLVIAYTMLTNLAKREELLQLILDKPSIVVGDEAHYMKNKTAKKSEIASRFKTHSRLALTGSPLANNVGEYYSMIHWVAPDFLGDWRWFNAEYTIPIAEGLYADSSRADRRNAKIRLAALRQIVAPKIHRRTIATLKDSLPPKKEFIIHLDISSIQREVYLSYLRGVKGAHQDMTSDSTSLWGLLKVLRVLLAHPHLLETKLRSMQRDRAQVNALERQDDDDDDRSVELLPLQVVSNTLETLTAQRGYRKLKTSFKMLALFKILDEAAKLGENVLLFSQSLDTLDFIQNVCGSQQRPYMRLDGKSKPTVRQSQVKEFNQGKGQVYLISTTAGGVGLNIYGASRVVIFDFQFNPVNEQQAIGRAYRIGQTKPVVVYWLICDGTFEKTLHNQQVFKNQMASRVVDKKDLLPKALQLKEYLTEPQQIDHQDSSAYRGHDSILDALLDSSEVSEGISSICTTETFEEEDTQKLPDEDQREAEAMARKGAQKINLAEEQMHYYHPSQQHLGEVRNPSAPSFTMSNALVHRQGSASSAVITAATATPQASIPGTNAATTSEDSTKSTAPSRPRLPSPVAFPAAPPHVPDGSFANIAAQALPTNRLYRAGEPQIPTRGYNVANSAGQVVSSTSPAEAYGSVNHHPLPDPLHATAFCSHRTSTPAMRRPATPAVAPDVSRWADHEQHPVQLPSRPEHVPNRSPSDPIPRSMSTGTMRRDMQPDERATETDGAAEWDSRTAGNPPHGPLLQGMSPTPWGTTQMGHAQTTATSYHTSLREDNAPMSMDTTPRRDSSATLDEAMANFKGVIERHAPLDLRSLVPSTIMRLQSHFKGGRLQRQMAWNALTSSVRERPGRAVVILREFVPLERVAEAAKEGRLALGNLLDKAQPPQGNRNSKDPDHTQRMLQRSISSDDPHNGGSTRKAQDMAAMREVLRNRQTKSQKVQGLQDPQQPQQPQQTQKPQKVKREDTERRRQTMPPAGSGGTSADPMVID